MAWMALVAAASAADWAGPNSYCDHACAGVTCDNYVPHTCDILVSTGCECDGCQCASNIPRRLQNSSNTSYAEGLVVDDVYCSGAAGSLAETRGAGRGVAAPSGCMFPVRSMESCRNVGEFGLDRARRGRDLALHGISTSRPRRRRD